MKANDYASSWKFLLIRVVLLLASEKMTGKILSNCILRLAKTDAAKR